MKQHHKLVIRLAGKWSRGITTLFCHSSSPTTVYHAFISTDWNIGRECPFSHIGSPQNTLGHSPCSYTTWAQGIKQHCEHIGRVLGIVSDCITVLSCQIRALIRTAILITPLTS